MRKIRRPYAYRNQAAPVVARLKGLDVPDRGVDTDFSNKLLNFRRSWESFAITGNSTNQSAASADSEFLRIGATWAKILESKILMMLRDQFNYCICAKNMIANSLARSHRQTNKVTRSEFNTNGPTHALCSPANGFQYDEAICRQTRLVARRHSGGSRANEAEIEKRQGERTCNHVRRLTQKGRLAA